MKSKTVLALGIAAAVAATSGTALAAGDGAKLFKKKCGVCHSVEPGKHKLGPSLAGVVGRKAGSVEDFGKYKAMKNADFVWDEEHLSAWISDAKKYAKSELGSNTAMSVKIRKESDREAIIEYLKAN